jgi:hypothetical protein
LLGPGVMPIEIMNGTLARISVSGKECIGKY